MRTTKWMLPFLLLGAFTVGITDSERGSARVEKTSDPTESRFAFRLTTPQPSVTEDSDGSFEIQIEGFGADRSRPGAPSIPTRTYLIAIPFGADPHLVVRSGEDRLLPQLRPAAVPGLVHEIDPRETPDGPLALSEGGESRRRDWLMRARTVRRVENPTLYSGETTFPDRVAWLGETGVLRSQRYVALHVAPVRYDPAIDGLRYRPQLEIEVRFEGGAEPAPRPLPEARFEEIYRERILNYAQGLRLRRERGDRSIVAPGAVAEPAAVAGGGTPRYRIRLSEDGIHRLEYTLLQSSGFPGYPVANWKLTNRGNAVPLQVFDGDSNGLIGPGEWVQFYGQKLDDDPKTVTNTDLADPQPDLFEARDYSDENAYFLTVEGAPQPAMPLRASAPAVPARTPKTDFESTVHLETDDRYAPLGGADPWYWAPVLNANNASFDSRVDSVPLPGLFSGSLPARVRVQMRGFTNFSGGTYIGVPQTHDSRIRFKNSSGVTLASHTSTFEGRSVFLHDFVWNPSGPILTSPAQVEWTLTPVGGASLNEAVLDWIEVSYRRKFEVFGEKLWFNWPDEDAEFLVSGLIDPAPAIYEITPTPGNPTVPSVRLVSALQAPDGGGGNSVRFRVDNDPALVDQSPRRFFVAGGGAIHKVTGQQFQAVGPSTLRSTANQADLLVIVHPALLDNSGTGGTECIGVAPTDCLNELLQYRATPAGGGLSSRIASLTEIEDEFNDGLHGATAVREFLRWILSDDPGEGWADPRPAYVLLLGDGSFDYKQGTASGNFVPTQIMFKDVLELGYYTSDSVMAAVVGDDPLPDLIVGRVAARDTAEVNRILHKILRYELDSATGTWNRHSLFVSDRGKTMSDFGEAFDFENSNQQAANQIGGGPYTYEHLRYWSDYVTVPPTPTPNPGAIRADLLSIVNGTGAAANGAAVLQFIGHGNFQVWSNDAFLDERNDAALDTDLLTNYPGGQPRLPWVMAHNCLTGGFHACPETGECTTFPDYTMGEDWLSRDGGGAVGVFSPSGLSFNTFGDQVSDAVVQALYGPTKERRVGQLVFGARAELCSPPVQIEACQGYTLQGDPATRLQLRTLPPPTQVQATAGNAQVSLSWTASPGAGVTYDVYRRKGGQYNPPPYAKLNASPVATTAFIDTTAQNVTPYEYYVQARDGEGFESPWSNFNSDCDVDGPDCVEATPLNPNPPAVPTGLSVSDPGTGNLLRVTWNANSEQDLAGYNLHIGTASGDYTEVLALGPATVTQIAGLSEGQMYYFALAARNTSGNVSALSGEASDFPALGPGLRAPTYVGDLRLTRVGNDIALSWGEVTTDVYGKPLEVGSYEILRGSDGSYRNSSLVSLGSCNAPCSSFTDTGAIGGGSLFYRVRALDVGGLNGGGLGAELPAGINLSLARSITPGQWLLEWAPVTTTMDGSPIDLLHYVVYAADTPFTRAQIRDGLLSPLTTTTATSLELGEPAAKRYYSVLAIDIRGNISPF